MRSRLPLWPMLSTVVGVGALNALIAYGIARMVSRDPILAIEPLALVALGLVGIGCLAAAASGWRSYVRRKAR